MYEYRAEILRVVDGDTVHARVDLGLDVRIDLTLRLARINAPELATADGSAAKQTLEWIVAAQGGTLTLRTLRDRREKYGRYLAEFVDSAGNSVNEQLVAAGAAQWYSTHPSP